MELLVITNLDLIPENSSMLAEYSNSFAREGIIPQIGSTLKLSNVTVKVKSVDHKMHARSYGAFKLCTQVYVGPLDGVTIEEFQKRQSLYQGN
jgi:hypothetical protein